MNMVLTAPGRSGLALPEFKIARSTEVLGDFVLPSLEIAGPGMHWVEVSRAVIAAGTELSDDTKRMLEAYVEYYDVARTAMQAGATLPRRARRRVLGVHRAWLPPRPCLSHSIGMTMIEFPKVDEGVDIPLEENMVLSVPRTIAATGGHLYMQDTWLITADGGIAPCPGLHRCRCSKARLIT